MTCKIDLVLEIRETNRALPVTTVWAQGCRISWKDLWSKKPFCQEFLSSKFMKQYNFVYFKRLIHVIFNKTITKFNTTINENDNEIFATTSNEEYVCWVTWILPAIQHPPGVIGGLCGDKLYLSIYRVPRLQDG